MTDIRKIDLHMHSTVSDGTDSPAEILEHVRAAGMDVFSLTDHDAIKGCEEILTLLKSNDPMFFPGIEFSCRDEHGKYHMLGYAYDPSASAIRTIVEQGHQNRIEKTKLRLEILKEKFGIRFDEEDIRGLFANNNPGKPHIANLLVRHGYTTSIPVAFTEFLNRLHVKSVYLRPEEAIEAILNSGGIPVLAHPTYGSGDELILGDEMDERIRRLVGFGLQGVEAYYSGFAPKITGELLGFAEKYWLYVTAGSDYHGTNKLVKIGQTHVEDVLEAHEGLRRFLTAVSEKSR